MRAGIVAPPIQLGKLSCPAPERSYRTSSDQQGENAVILPGLTDHRIQYLVAHIPGIPKLMSMINPQGGGKPGEPANRAAKTPSPPSPSR